MIDKNSTKEEVLEAIKGEGVALRDASEELKGDRDVVMAAVRQDGTALQYAGRLVLRRIAKVLTGAFW